MKSRAISSYKSIIRHAIIACTALLIYTNIVSADFDEFLGTLESAGFDTQELLQAPSVTRYETARLLNMIECKDCLHPSPRMAMTYTPSFWHTFSALPHNDFDDIQRGEAYYEDESYYYCVAYAGDQEYMRGYPTGQSPICEGEFCGLQHTTTAEYLQILTNITAQYSYQSIRAPRLAIHARSQSTTTLNKYYQTIAQSAYESCPTGSCSLRRTDELQVYLTYCRYHLDECQMQPLAGVSQGSWPVSELNYLQQNNILTYSMLDELNIHQPISGRSALELAYRAFGKTACTPDTDYDCDGWTNTIDNCSATYNPSQHDTDDDGVGDVCDPDIDGDGSSNPIGIVDERNTIDITKLQQEGIEDTCLRDPTPGRVCTSIPQHGLRIQASLGSSKTGGLPPIAATATLHGNGPISRSINGTAISQTTPNISYQPHEPGLYVIQAEQSGPHTTAIASSSVRVATQTPRTYKTRSTPTIEYIQGNTWISIKHLTNSQHNTYQRTHNGAIVENESDRSYTFQGRPGIHTITIQGDNIRNQTTIICETKTCSSATLQTSGPWEIHTPITIQTNLQGIDYDDIYRIKRSDGSQIRYTNGLTAQPTYTTPGHHTLTQTITLYNGHTYTQNISLYISEPEVGDYHIYNSTDNDGIQTHTDNTTTQTLAISACLMLQSSETTVVDSKTPDCYGLYQTGEINTYQCDLDNDGTPDICDADIDNDGIKNPIGLLIDENDDCSITEDIINWSLLRGVSTEEETDKEKSNEDFTSAGITNVGHISPETIWIMIVAIVVIMLTTLQVDNRKRLLCALSVSGTLVFAPLIYAQYTTYTVDRGVIHRALETNPRKNPHQYRGFSNLSCSIDNCPFTANPNQIDTNQNGVGNACEDGDFDNDGIPDSIDEDDDNDTIPDIWEQGPGGTYLDTDGDGAPDHLDLDSDGDGIYDLTELGHNEDAIQSLDSDEDGIIDNGIAIGNNGLADIVETSNDSGILDYTGDGQADEPIDTDGDNIPDFQDTDSDNDSISDSDEMTSNSGGSGSNPVDTDGDGVDDYRDLDSDGDGISDSDEAGDGSINTPPLDSDHDDIPNFQNPDADGDGISDDQDECPLIPGLPASQGCPYTDDTNDSDGDGIRDDQDECPLIWGYNHLAGCPDNDGDGISDDQDECPLIPGLIALDGCPYSDTDGDGIRDDQDECPNDPLNICNNNGDQDTAINNSNLLLQFESCQDNQPHIQITECTMCPCQYAGFNAQIQAGDTVRARLSDSTTRFPWSLSLPQLVNRQ